MNNPKEYWQERYLNHQTGWDLKIPSPPLKAYIDQLENKCQKILIPGAGNAHEAEYLFINGFENVFVADIAKTPLENLKHRIPDFPVERLLNIDFFDINQKFDLILEQTFFCALMPHKRVAYANKMKDLLYNNAKLVGVLFDFPLTKTGPPFGGSIDEYKTYFSKLFNLDILERCNNSHQDRQGKELFFKAINKK
jgi:thiopurine S-methyltransferase